MVIGSPSVDWRNDASGNAWISRFHQGMVDMAEYPPIRQLLKDFTIVIKADSGELSVSNRGDRAFRVRRATGKRMHVPA